MKTKEYIESLHNLNHDDTNPEFLSYIAVNLKSRRPAEYKEIQERFKAIESEIYAQYQIDDARTEMPF